MNVSATAASRGFADLLNRVHYKGESFIIERAGKPIAKLVPIEAEKKLTLREYFEQLRALPLPDEDFANDVLEGIRNQPPMEEVDW